MYRVYDYYNGLDTDELLNGVYADKDHRILKIFNSPARFHSSANQRDPFRNCLDISTAGHLSQYHSIGIY